MSLLKLEDLYQANEKRSKSNRKVFEEILKLCHRRILQINRKVRITQCYFKIPAYVFGYPAYKVEDVNDFLCHKLTKNGLLVYPIDYRTIYINWDPEMVDFERYQKTRQKDQIPIVYDNSDGGGVNGDEDGSDENGSNGSNFGSNGSNFGSSRSNGGGGVGGGRRGSGSGNSGGGRSSGSGRNRGQDKVKPAKETTARKLKMTPNQPMAVIHFDSDFEDMIPVNTKKISARRDEKKVSHYPWFGK